MYYVRGFVLGSGFMKKFYSAIILSLFISSNALAMDDSDLGELAAEAKTDWGARAIYEICQDEPRKKNFRWQYGEDCKCALRAGDAKSEAGAKIIVNACEL